MPETFGKLKLLQTGHFDREIKVRRGITHHFVYKQNE